MLSRAITGLLALSAAFVWAGVVWANPADNGYPQPAVAVEVFTDKAVYYSGENVVIKVITTLDGKPTPATLDVWLIITDNHGKTIKKDVSHQFKMVSAGVFVSSGMVKGPGVREVHVGAKVTKRVGCKCQKKVFKGLGATSYDVKVDPLKVSIDVNRKHLSVCDTLEVKIHLSHGADVKLVAVYPHGVTRNLVVPGWLPPGEHWIKVKPKAFFDVGPMTIKVIAVDAYWQKATDSVHVVLDYGNCDC